MKNVILVSQLQQDGQGEEWRREWEEGVGGGVRGRKGKVEEGGRGGREGWKRLGEEGKGGGGRERKGRFEKGGKGGARVWRQFQVLTLYTI